MKCERTACGRDLTHGVYYKIWNDPSRTEPRVYCASCGRKILAYNPELKYEHYEVHK